MIEYIAELKAHVREESCHIDDKAARIISKLPTMHLRKLGIQVR